MTDPSYERDLEQRVPWIDWRTPIRIEHTDGFVRYACRFCIARHGLKGTNVKDLPKTAEEVLAHIREKHAQ